MNYRWTVPIDDPAREREVTLAHAMLSLVLSFMATAVAWSVALWLILSFFGLAPSAPLVVGVTLGSWLLRDPIKITF